MKPRVIVKNGSRYCSGCGEYLGMTCDPFGRSECSSKCHPQEDAENETRSEEERTEP